MFEIFFVFFLVLTNNKGYLLHCNILTCQVLDKWKCGEVGACKHYRKTTCNIPEPTETGKLSDLDALHF